MLPPSFSPVFVMKLMIPAGELLAKTEAEPPLNASTLETNESKRVN